MFDLYDNINLRALGPRLRQRTVNIIFWVSSKRKEFSISERAWRAGKQSGPSCSKLTTSLVNDSLKFTSSDTQVC